MLYGTDRNGRQIHIKRINEVGAITQCTIDDGMLNSSTRDDIIYDDRLNLRACLKSIIAAGLKAPGFGNKLSTSLFNACGRLQTCGLSR